MAWSMPKAKASTVTPLSHGMVLLASCRNREGLARSERFISHFLQSLPSWEQCRPRRELSLLHEHDGYLIDMLLDFLPQHGRGGKRPDDQTGKRQRAQNSERRTERHRPDDRGVRRRDAEDQNRHRQRQHDDGEQ